MSSRITQLVKGKHCNAQCPMCLSLRSDYGEPDELTDIRSMPSFDTTYFASLMKAYLAARNKFSDELVITSFGDPLDKRNKPQHLPLEIRYAVLAGFKQITLITNSIALTKEQIGDFNKNGLTHLSISVHATDQANYSKYLGTNAKLKEVYEKSLFANALGLIVRHNYMWNTTLDFYDVLEQSYNAGAAQITLIEAVPVNEFAEFEHCPLPEVPESAKLITSHGWGMDIYAIDGMSVAFCRFGQDDPGFDRQQKNLYINVLNDRVLFREGAYFDLEN